MPETDDVWVEADRDICIGSGNCVSSAAGIFALGDDGKVTVLKGELDDDDLEVAEEAVDLCPVRALALARGARGES